MDNTWLYFFSAIMQSIAALAALFGVFVVFRIEKIQNNIERLRNLCAKVIYDIKRRDNGKPEQENNKFCKKYQIPENIIGFIKYSDFDVYNMFNEFWINRHNFHPDFFPCFDGPEINDNTGPAFKILLDFKKEIVNKLKISLLLSSICIVLSIIFLAMEKIHYSTNWIILVASIAIATIAYIAQSIFSITKD